MLENGNPLEGMVPSIYCTAVYRLNNEIIPFAFFGVDSHHELMYAHTMKITGKKTTNAPRIHSHGYKSHSPHDGSQAIMRPFHLLHHFIADALEVKTT